MINRYCTHEMTAIWSEENKYKHWQNVEIAASQAWMENGKISQESFNVISNSRIYISQDELLKREQHVQHEVIAFLITWKELSKMEEDGRFIHYGMTSSDLIDTATSLMIKQSGSVILNSLNVLLSDIKNLAIEHKYTKVVARTHGMHAEETTFGFKLCNYFNEISRTRDKIKAAIDENSLGMFSGAVGNYINISIDIEKRASELLGLQPATISTQIISRDRYASLIFSLALMGSVFERLAIEIRSLQRTEILELEEPFGNQQKGSSAMPHKKNPWKSENICGLARVLRGYTVSALENVPLWHERDMSHSSVERIILPDSFQLLHFMTQRLSEIINGLTVRKDNMTRNLQLFGGIIHSQALMNALIDAGWDRESAYSKVQAHALTAWDDNQSFKEFVYSDEKIRKILSSNTLDSVFSSKLSENTIDVIFESVLGD